LLEDLREINRRYAYFGSNVGQRPPSRQITRKDELGSIDQSLASDTRSGLMCGARPKSPLHYRQRQTLCFQGLGYILAQAVAE
jgi:hypothetical protein